LNDSPVPLVRRRILRNLFLLFCTFTLLAFGLLGWYATTDSFQGRMRNRVIAELEKATGGRVELGELHTIPFRLRIDARNLTIHGREAADQPPFLHVDRVDAELKIISLLETSIGLHSLVLVHPVVHLVDYADGTTNVPAPLVKHSADQGSLERLVSLSVSRLEVRTGEFQWQDRKVPFDFSARDLALMLHYSLLRQRYEARVSAGTIVTRWQQYPEFVWAADASFALARAHADINNLTVRSGQSEFHFAGQLQDFHNPQINGEYHGSANLAELSALVRQKEFRKGIADFAGKGSWNLRDFAAQGTLQAKDLDWSHGNLQTHNARVDAGFSVTPAHLHIGSIKANLLGGDLFGDVDVANWQTSLEPSSRQHHVMGRVSPESLQRGSVRLQLAGFPLAPALGVLSSRKLPLDRLDFTASTNGTVDLLWVGSIRDAEARMKLELSAPLHPAPNEVPVHGRIEATYRGSRDELEVGALHLASASSEVEASGTLAPTSVLRFSSTTHNLREWTPLLEAACAQAGYGASHLPFAVHGWAGFNGNASGRLSALSFNGTLEVFDFDTSFPATGRTPAQDVHWDALSTGLQYSASSFAARNGSLIHGHTVAHFDVSAVLTGGAFTGNDPFTLHADILAGDVAEFSRLTGVDRPLTGTLGLTVNISGTRENPHGDGHFEISDGTAYGVAIPSLRGDLRLANGEAEFNNLAGRTYGNASLSGNGRISTSSHEFRLTLAGRDIDLRRFPGLQARRFTMDGTADFTANVSGTPESPLLDAHFHIRGLALDNQRIGDFFADAVTHDRQLSITAHSEFEKSELKVQGAVSMERDFPADLTLDFHDLDLVPLLSIYLPGKFAGPSPADGTIQLAGPLKIPRNLKAAAEIRSFSAEVEHVRVQSVGPIRFEVVDQSVMIESLHLAGSGTDFVAHGRAHLTDAQDVDVRLDGSVNMTLLQSLNPRVLARGNLNVDLSATGTLHQPVLQGRLVVKDTFISDIDFPSGLSDLNGILLFDRDRVQIDKLSGTTGGGTVALTGSAIYQSGGFVLDLGASAQGVRLRYPPGVSSTANAELRLTGSTNAAVLSGDVVVTKLAVTPGFDFGAYIERSRQTAVFTQSDSLAARLRMDVHVTTTSELQMQTAIARLSGNADLRVRGTADRPVILGRAEVLEGEISFNGNKYRLERGDVTFANPAKTQPIIDLQAATRVRDYDITVRFRGDASVPNGLKITWQSEPHLPEADVIALLALGRTQEESANAQSSGALGFGGDASNLLINQALNSTVNSRLQRLFGASRIKIDPQGLASETAVVRGPQLTVEQQVVSNLTVTYSTNVSVSNQQVIQAEYNLTRNVSIVALRDQNGVVSLDLKVRTRRK